MMKRETFAIASIYVPAKRRATLDPAKAREIAEVMGVSESRISQIRSKALSQLRSALAPLQATA